MAAKPERVSPLRLSLKVEGSLAAISLLMEPIRALICEALAGERGEAFALACAEAVNNAALHGGGLDAGNTVDVELSILPTEILLAVQDLGGGEALERRLQAELSHPYEGRAVDEMPEAGVGLWLMRQGSDRISYRRTAGGNFLELAIAR